VKIISFHNGQIICIILGHIKKNGVYVLKTVFLETVSHTTCEVAVILHKHHILGRVKAYNVLDLIDLTSIALENYYKKRLRDFTDSRTSLISFNVTKNDEDSFIFKKRNDFTRK